jgi:3-(3-hydroxy-phenyl)propionate hydroxylase
VADHGPILDAIIVGYGPVGAVLANLLGRAGFTVAVFEATSSVYHLPRAAHFDAEIMRVFRAIELGDEILPATAPIVGMNFIAADGTRLFGLAEQLEHGTARSNRRGYMFYQPDLERALRAGVARYRNVEVNLACEVTQIEPAADAVEVTTRSAESGIYRTAKARYVIGCDGARSVTRARIGTAIDDLGFDQQWLVVDTMLRREVALPAVVQQICDPARPTTFVPSAGKHRRWEFMLMPGEAAEEMQRFTRVHELLARWVKPDDVAIMRAVVYPFHALVAERWRAGPVIVAGDAAHQMPPFLGQGMCSGIRDAANLAWKLAMVLRGAASDALLDTYQTEREPHVRRIAELAVTLGRIIQTTDPAVAKARDEAFRARARGNLEAAAAILPDVSMPGLGPGVIAANPGHEDEARVGSLLPEPRVKLASGESALLDDVLGGGFATISRYDPRPQMSPGARAALERLGARFVTLARAGSPPLESAPGVAGAEEADATLAPWLDGGAVVIVRPDRYVFGVARGRGDLDSLVAELGRALSAS